MQWDLSLTQVEAKHAHFPKLGFATKALGHLHDAMVMD